MVRPLSAPRKQHTKTRQSIRPAGLHASPRIGGSVSRPRYTKRRRQSITLKQWRQEQLAGQELIPGFEDALEPICSPEAGESDRHFCTCPPGQEARCRILEELDSSFGMPWHCPRLRTPTV